MVVLLGGTPEEAAVADEVDKADWTVWELLIEHSHALRVPLIKMNQTSSTIWTHQILLRTNKTGALYRICSISNEQAAYSQMLPRSCHLDMHERY